MQLFELFATLGLDTSQFDAGLDGAIQSTKGVREALEKLQKESEETGRKGGQSASFFKSQWADVKDSLNQVFTFSAGQLVAQGISSGVNALKQMASESINLASDLNEVQNVIDVTFGTDAQKIESWAKRAKNSVGMSELSAKRYVGTLGAMLKSSGLAGDAVADLSMQMVTLSGDMASFYNLDYDTAFQKIRSGISGETEPLKQLGINMSVANLEAFRLAEGIETAYDKMSQSEQVELRIKYLAQATKDASGDFERTANSYANAKKTLQSNIDAIKADLGNLFLPIAEEFTNGVNSIFELFNGEDSIENRLKAINSSFDMEELNISLDFLTAESMISELEELEQKTELTEEEQQRWMHLLRGLTEVIPDTASLIDLQTGSIEGGTKALRENTEEWEKNQRAKAAQEWVGSLRAQQEAAYNAATQNEFNRIKAQYRLDAAEQEALRLAEEYASETGQQWAGTIESAKWLAATNKGRGAARINENHPLHVALMEYEEQRAIIEQAEAAQRGLVEDYQLTVRAAEDAEKAVADLLNTEGTGLAEVTFSVKDYAKAWEDVVDIMAEVEDYQNRVTEATRSQVNSLLGGWKEIEKIDGKFGKDEKGEPKTFALSDYTKRLQEQELFAREYKDYLMKLQLEGGVSGDLLSYLAANINEENAEILHALAHDTTGQLKKEFSDAFDARNAANDALTDVASDVQLTNDETYQSMKTLAEEMLAEYEGQAAAYGKAMENNMTSMKDEIDAALPDFQTQAENIKATLAKAFDLSDVGVSFPSIGSIFSGLFSSGGSEPEGRAVGIDYVPYDGYMAQLHEGERVMTKLENHQFTRDQGTGMAVDLSGFGQIVAAAVRENLQGMVVAIDGQAAGQILIEPINRGLSDLAYAGRFAN